MKLICSSTVDLKRKWRLDFFFYFQTIYVSVVGEVTVVAGTDRFRSEGHSQLLIPFLVATGAEGAIPVLYYSLYFSHHLFDNRLSIISSFFSVLIGFNFKKNHNWIVISWKVDTFLTFLKVFTYYDKIILLGCLLCELKLVCCWYGLCV
jgi:hypothetical protein